MIDALIPKAFRPIARGYATFGYVFAALGLFTALLNPWLGFAEMAVAAVLFLAAYRRTSARLRRWSKAKARGERPGAQKIVDVTMSVYAPAEQLAGPMGLALQVGQHDIDEVEATLRSELEVSARRLAESRWPDADLRIIV